MECLLGVCGRDFIVLAADCNAGRSILVMKQNENKMVKLDDKVGMVVCGDPGDAASFGELVQKNIQLYKIRHGYSLSPHAAANFIRKYLADSLRRNPYLVNLLMGGFSEDQGTSLYYMDYLGTMTKVPFASHGYGSFFTLSIMDKYYREDLSEQEAIELIGKCITEVQKRLVINMPEFMIHVIDKDGVRLINTAKGMES